jgi:hypothetical protein
VSGPGDATDETQGTDDCCGAEPTPADWVGDCWCTLPPGHPGEHRCQPCTDRHGAPGWTEQPAVVSQPDGEATAAVYLSSRCDACRHTLNWHRNDVGCTVALCVCGRFQAPAAEDPAP